MFFDLTLSPFSQDVQLLLRNAPDDYIQMIENVWNVYKDYASPNYQVELLRGGSKLTSLLWEMILGCALLENGLTLQKSDNDNRPDLCLIDKEKKIWIECCVPRFGQESHAGFYKVVDNTDDDCTVSWIDNDFGASRYLQGLYEKKIQYSKWLASGIVSVDDIFIIAMNGREVRLSISNNALPDIMLPLYGMGNIGVVIGGSEDGKVFYEHKKDIAKNDVTKIPTQFFLNEDNAIIDGVIYSDFWFGSLSSQPRYCFVQNILSKKIEDFGFGKFMQVYEYPKGSIRLKRNNYL